MAATSRLSALRAFVTAVRIAVRPGSPSLPARVAALPRLVLATVRGQYRGTSFGRLALMAAAAGYVVSPVDVLPEALLGVVGLVDDAVILSWLVAALVTETESFLEWERRRAGGAAGRGADGAGSAVGAQTVPGDVLR